MQKEMKSDYIFTILNPIFFLEATQQKVKKYIYHDDERYDNFKNKMTERFYKQHLLVNTNRLHRSSSKY